MLPPPGFHLCRYLTAGFCHPRNVYSFITSPTSLRYEMEPKGCICFGVDYMLIEDVENVERYRPGGYHPVRLDDDLRDRYRIVNKLGFGAYSTVWLAWDHRAQSLVAIKIVVSASDSQEVTILRQLGLGDLDKVHAHPGKAIVIPMLDEFSLTRPNGKHQCIVTAPARMSLLEAKERGSLSGLLQLPVARAIAAQLILAVSFLHSQGVVHAGK
jgi:serine/threonine-protein kinase SRPK3